MLLKYLNGSVLCLVGAILLGACSIDDGVGVESDGTLEKTTATISAYSTIVTNAKKYTIVKSGPAWSYTNIGSVDQSEEVKILWAEYDFSFIEYKVTKTGQPKRGYVWSSDLNANSQDFRSWQLYWGISHQKFTVYSGPGEDYAITGSLGAGRVAFLYRIATVWSHFWFVEYDTSLGRKRGYIVTTKNDDWLELPYWYYKYN